jgi:hypothetical protein
VGDGDPVVEEQRSDDRGAHALTLWLAACGLKYDLVGAQDRVAQDDGGARQSVRGVVDAQVFAFHGITHQADDGLDRDAAGDLPGVVPAHTVSQNQQPDVGVEGYGVFVVLANASGVGLAHAVQFAFEAHQAPGSRHVWLL